MKTLLKLVPLVIFLFITAYQYEDTLKTINISKNWKFAPDENNVGISEK